ncbi:MAG: AMP-binding protein [Nocardioides sp.]|uniref:class I adenylate-forming enzyme family protein n=1 Tax=Nocardioides sp. TaxID=35761 RepID=UPI0039E607FB
MFVQDLVRHAAARYGDRPAIIEGDRTLGFREFEERTIRLGNALLARGLQPGDAVSCVLPNCIEELLTYVALARTGLIRVGLNARDTPADHAFKVADSQSRAVITDGVDLPETELHFTKEDIDEMSLTGPGGVCDVPLDPSRTYRLAYTGGTTGRPKGVILPLRTLQAQVTNYLLEHVPGIEVGDVMLHAAPVSHAGGSYFLPHLTSGATNVLLSAFRPGAFLEALERTGAQRTFLVPTMMAALLQEPNVADVKTPNLKQIAYSASPIAPSVAEGCRKVFGEVLSQTYGQAEAPMTITHLRPSEHDRIGSAGRAYAMTAVRIVDAEGREMATGDSGEIACRGAIVSDGYWNRPEATAETLRDGWLHTGDLGYLDEEGFVYLLDRENDVIISGGFNVYPREVEDALTSHPAVIEAAVVSVQDEKWGEIVQAVVAVSAEVDSRDLDEFMRDRVAGYKRPRAYHVWDNLPKSAAGKILRRDVRDQIRQTTAQREASR